MAPVDMSKTPKFAFLRVSTPHPTIVLVEFNRPERLNALNDAMFREIAAYFRQLAKDCVHDDLRAVILTGAGNAFTAGLDSIILFILQ